MAFGVRREEEATLSGRDASQEPNFSLAAVPPTAAQRRLVLAVVGALLAAFAVVAPFAAVPLRRIDAFIPATQAIFCVTDFITVALLFSQFSITRSGAVLVLANAYLFTGLIVIPWGLTFPGAFAPVGLLGASLQSTAWLFTSWHLGFPAAVCVYACSNHGNRATGILQSWSARPVIGWSVAIVLGVVCGLTWLAIAGDRFMPRLFLDSSHPGPLALQILGFDVLLTVLALGVLWVRQRSVLDQWVFVATFATLLELSVGLLVPARYDLGWYASRVFPIVTSSSVLVVLLAELTRLYADAFFLERQRSVERLRDANEQLMETQIGLKSREAHLEAILATVPDAMVVIDERGVIRSISATAERLFGYPAEEVQGRNVSMLMPGPYRNEHDGYLATYLTTGERRIIGKGRVVVGQRKNRTTFPMELSVGEVLLNGGRQFIGFVRDLTQREERERLLHETQSELLHVSRLSSMGQMASALAHELNQPLAAMANYLQGSRRMLESSSDERAGLIRAALDKAAEQALRAGQIIQRLRDFVARGETERRIESIKKLIEETIALALVVAKEQSITVGLQCDPAVDLVLIDRIQVQQVLLNLLRNAIEAMQASAIRELVVSTSPGEHDMVSVTVTDTGSGIGPDVRSKLFQPFVTSKRQGMGMGLSLCRTIIELHGGQISAEANPSGGTIFRFTIRGVTERDLEDAG